MSLDRYLGRNFDSTLTSVHNPWISDVVPPIEQDLRLFEFPEDIEAALRNAEELPAQVEDRSVITTNSIIAARRELSNFPEFDLLSRTDGGFHDHYKAGRASVADVMRYTLGAAAAKPETMRHVDFYWSATFGTEKPLFPFSTDNERNANVSAAREWFSNNQETMANALKDPLYELASKFVSSHSRALGEFDLVCGVGIRRALDSLKSLPFDENTVKQVEIFLTSRLQDESSELLAQRVQLEVASAEEAIDKYRGGILLSSPHDYGYALDDLQRCLSYDEVRSQINEDDAAAAIESLEKWRAFVTDAFDDIEYMDSSDVSETGWNIPNLLWEASIAEKENKLSADGSGTWTWSSENNSLQADNLSLRTDNPTQNFHLTAQIPHLSLKNNVLNIPSLNGAFTAGKPESQWNGSFKLDKASIRTSVATLDNFEFNASNKNAVHQTNLTLTGPLLWQQNKGLQSSSINLTTLQDTVNRLPNPRFISQLTGSFNWNGKEN